VNIAWKYLYSAKDSWLGPTQNLGSIGALYNLTMDPYEKYDMIFNGAAPMRVMTTSDDRRGSFENRSAIIWTRVSSMMTATSMCSWSVPGKAREEILWATDKEDHAVQTCRIW
jgi:hypothetical protein